MSDTPEELTRQNAALKAELEDLKWVADKTDRGVKHLYRELEKQNSELKKLDQLKSEFISVVSHELRTPLAVIREGISQVVDGVHGPAAPGQRQTLELALKGADRLTRLVTDLLDLSKMESGKTQLKLEPTDLAACVKEVVANVKPSADKKKIEITTDVPGALVFYADRDKLEQVVTNLLTNAIKFTDKGSVRIRLWTSGDEARLSVEDTGIGILAEDLPRLFIKFEQFGPKRAGADKGAGLGLAIVKGLVELHGGSIDADSQPGRGTRFDVRLPLRSARQAIDEMIRHARERAAARGTELSVITVTLSRVPQAADKEAGASSRPDLPAADPALARIEAEIRDTLRRREDLLIRDANCLWVLLPETTRVAAQAVLDRIRERVEGLAAGKTAVSGYSAECRLIHLERHERV